MTQEYTNNDTIYIYSSIDEYITTILALCPLKQRHTLIQIQWNLSIGTG